MWEHMEQRIKKTCIFKATICFSVAQEKRKYCLNSRLFLGFPNLPIFLFKFSRVLYHSFTSDFVCVGGNKVLSKQETRVRYLKIQTRQYLKYKIMNQNIHTTVLHFIYSHVGNENKPEIVVQGQLFTVRAGTNCNLPCSYIHCKKPPCKYCKALHPKMFRVFRIDIETQQCQISIQTPLLIYYTNKIHAMEKKYLDKSTSFQLSICLCPFLLCFKSQ